MNSNCLSGIHAVEEAIVAGRPLDRVVVARGQHSGRVQKIVQLARARGVPVRFEDRSQLDRAAGSEHQGVLAFAASRAVVEIEDLLGKNARQLLVLLDGIEDPHNLGAIVRTALAAGAGGIVIPERRAVGLTETVARVSAGALEHLSVARVKNLARAMEQMKAAGYWLVGLDQRAEKSYSEVDYRGSVGIVMGNEGAGLHELVRKRCDFVVSIPTMGPIHSLNVSVAAGIVLFEAARQRSNSAQKTC